MCHPIGVWRSEDNLKDLGLCFHHMVPGNQTEVIRFGGRHLYLLTQLTALLVIVSDSTSGGAENKTEP